MGCDRQSLSPGERADGRPGPARTRPSTGSVLSSPGSGSGRAVAREAREADRARLAGRAHRERVRVDRGRRPGPSAVLGERDLEFPPRADEHAERIPDHRARSCLAADRIRRLLGLDCDPRRPPVSVSTLISRGPDGPPMRVVLGGTFDILHEGHEALLRAAFEGRPEQVLIGLTTDRFARESRTRVNSYAVRERNLKRFLAARKWRPARIEPIDAAYGPAGRLPHLDVIPVSPERYPVAGPFHGAGG